MKNIIIRNVKKEDIPEVVDIRITGWQDAYKGIIDENYLNNIDRNENIERIKNNYQDHGFIVAELNNEIVGFCRYIYDDQFSKEYDVDCEIMAIYTKPDLKGLGIGTKMFDYVITEFKKLNKKKMIIWCLKDNKKSQEFYKKMGGEIFFEKDLTIADKNYKEVGFIFNIK